MTGFEDLAFVLTPARLEELLQSIRRIEEAADSLALSVENSADRVGSAVGDTEDLSISAADRVARAAEKKKNKIQKLQEEIEALHKDEIAGLEKNTKAWKDELAERERLLKSYTKKLEHESQKQSKLKDFRRGIGDLTGILGGGLLGGVGMKAVGKSAVQRIMGQLPFGAGGLIGLLMHGTSRKEEFRSLGSKAAHQFAQVGDAGVGAADNMTASLKNLREAWLSNGEEILTVNAVLRENSIGWKTVSQDSIAAGSSWGKSIGETLAGLDALMQVPLGTFAKTAGEAFAFSLAPIKETQAALFKLTDISKSAGINMTQLAQTMNQNLSTMRLHGQGIDDLAEGYKGIVHILDGAGFGEVASGRLALEAQQQITGGLENLSPGMGAHLMQNYGGMDKSSGLSAAWAYRTMRGEGTASKRFTMMSKMLSNTANAPADIMAAQRAKAAGDDFKASEILSSLKFKVAKYAEQGNVGKDGALVLAEYVASGMAKPTKEQAQKFADAVQTPMEKLQKAFNDMKKDANTYAQAQEKILLHLANVGMGILGVLTTGIMGLVDYGAAYAADDNKGMDKIQSAMAAAMVESNESLLTGVGGIAEVFKNAGIKSSTTHLGSYLDVRQDIYKKKENIETAKQARMRKAALIESEELARNAAKKYPDFGNDPGPGGRDQRIVAAIKESITRVLSDTDSRVNHVVRHAVNTGHRNAAIKGITSFEAAHSIISLNPTARPNNRKE